MIAPTVTVIVSFYNQARQLELVLAALASQTDLDFNLIVADDGSDPRAEQLLATRRSEEPFPIRSVWQSDDGFRKARILNCAALETDADLLIFLDVDCIPFRSLVEVYRLHYQPQQFLTGSVGHLESELSARITPEEVRAGQHERELSLRQRLVFLNEHWRNVIKRNGKLTRPRIRGGNFAVSADLFRRVDGFDEVYAGYGREDSDLRNRMRNAGASGISLWPYAIALHLDRSVSPSGIRRSAPPELYAPSKSNIEARIGLSSHG